MTGTTIILPLSTIEENIDDSPNDQSDDEELQRTNQQATDKNPSEQTTHLQGKRTAIFTLSASGVRSPVFIIIEISFAKLHRK